MDTPNTDMSNQELLHYIQVIRSTLMGRYRVDKETANEAVYRAFAKVWDKDYDPKAFQQYFTVAAKNELLDMFKYKNKISNEDPEEPFYQMDYETVEPLDEIERKLPNVHVQLFGMLRKGFHPKTIAEKMGKSHGAVRVMKTRMIQYCKAVLVGILACVFLPTIIYAQDTLDVSGKVIISPDSSFFDLQFPRKIATDTTIISVYDTTFVQDTTFVTVYDTTQVVDSVYTLVKNESPTLRNVWWQHRREAGERYNYFDIRGESTADSLVFTWTGEDIKKKTLFPDSSFTITVKTQYLGQAEYELTSYDSLWTITNTDIINTALMDTLGGQESIYQMANQFAKLTGDQPANINAVSVVLEWNLTQEVSASPFSWSSGNNTRLTIEEAGDYLITVALPQNSATAEDRTNQFMRVLVNGTVQDVGFGACAYRRNTSGHDAVSNTVSAFLPGLSQGDYIEITNDRESNGEPIPSEGHTLYAEKIEGQTVFAGRGTQVVAGTNINQASKFEWSTQDRADTGFTHSTGTNPESITLDNAGNYLVMLTIPETSSAERPNAGARILLDGVSQGEAKQGYIRNLLNHNNASVHYYGVVQSSSANQVLEVQMSVDGNTGTVTVPSGQQANIFVMELPSSNVYYGEATQAGGADNWNPGTAAEVNWSTDQIIDTAVFTHDTATNNTDITVDEAGDYFFAFNVPLSGSVTRSNVEASILVNGTALGEYDTRHNYIRNSDGHNDSSISMAGILSGLSANDVITIEVIQEAAAGTVDDTDHAQLLIWKKEEPAGGGGATSVSGSVDSSFSLSGDIDKQSLLSGSSDAQLIVSGNLIKQALLSGDIQTASALSAAIVKQMALSGQLESESSLSASLVKQALLSGSIDAASALSGNIVIVDPGITSLSGSVDTTSELSANLTLLKNLQGIVETQTAMSGDLIKEVSLSGNILTVSSLSADASIQQSLSGTILVTSTISGELTPVGAAWGGTIDITNSPLYSLSFQIKPMHNISIKDNPFYTINIKVKDE